jgi:hypothetical protein
VSGASQEGPVQGLQDPGSRGGQGKKPPKKKKEGRKKIGRPFFPPFMAEKQANGIESPETPDQEKDPVIDHSVTPSDTFHLSRTGRKGKTTSWHKGSWKKDEKCVRLPGIKAGASSGGRRKYRPGKKSEFSLLNSQPTLAAFDLRKRKNSECFAAPFPIWRAAWWLWAHSSFIMD